MVDESQGAEARDPVGSEDADAARGMIHHARHKSMETARHEQEEAAVGGYAAGETGISESASGPSAASASSDLEADIDEDSPVQARAEAEREPDPGPRLQVTGTQRFGRDVGMQGLSQEDVEDEGPVRRPSNARSHNPDWTAVLGKLGGSSPGSQENLALGERFSKVQFPASRAEILRQLPAIADFQFRAGISVDLRHAVTASRQDRFRNLNELIDCVKDELRRTERLHPA